MKRHLSLIGNAILLCVTGVTCAHAEDKKPGRYYGPEGYPAEALRLGQQGRVVMHLIISTEGAVTGCAVTTSSGSPSLDADACEKALTKVHFKPAKNDAGQPVQSSYDLSMRYVLPNDSPPPATATPAPAP
ncbi:energy transducer TonB [Sphingomonas sp. AR_OL41]|uniref:energy transducer TonB n=1 Tax=Sphingomonas sp. AR_OL41 TaxID=3042729 RepID=UPI002480B413|nr:energy transducer TonB [Sphingomonas sp. AR_OL41]MDH7975081.1 energy transducer TonB [Sphingomonas sp. AR_OL41]